MAGTTGDRAKRKIQDTVLRKFHTNFPEVISQFPKLHFQHTLFPAESNLNNFGFKSSMILPWPLFIDCWLLRAPTVPLLVQLISK